jgi:predicted nucleic acid-binding protein
VSVYLDANVLVALFTNDPFDARAWGFLERQQPVLIVSDFAGAEFAAVIGRRVRMKILSNVEARQAFAYFDSWTTESTQQTETIAGDLAQAAALLRRLDTNLRTPDAIHIAIARRLGADLLTFDRKMAASAKALGVPVASA